MGLRIPNDMKINAQRKMNFYPTKKNSCRQVVDKALVDSNSTNRQMMGALLASPDTFGHNLGNGQQLPQV